MLMGTSFFPHLSFPHSRVTCKKGKSVPLQAWSGPEGSRKLRFPDFMITAQEGGKVVSLTHRPHLPPGNSPGTHFCQRLSRPQGHSAIGRIMSMKNSNHTIWNRTSDLRENEKRTRNVRNSEIGHLEYLSLDGNILLKCTLKKCDVEVDWIHLAEDRVE